MFKKITIVTVIIAAAGLLILGAVNRTLAKSAETDRSAEVELLNTEELFTLLPAASGDLEAGEAAGLIYMLEEEKLAHDVYVTLYSAWNLPIFQNISQSEQTHMEAIRALLVRYEVGDPASDAVGVFTDPGLQSLYNELIARGSGSLAEALKVGAAIEEIDILDLQKYMQETEHADIREVYANLSAGSGNHLRAFVAVLRNKTGEEYQPQFLTAEEYQAILSTGSGSGYGQRGTGEERVLGSGGGRGRIEP